MKSPWRRVGAHVCALAMITGAPALWATQPAPVDVSVESRLARYGSSFLHVTNRGRETYRMYFLPGPAGTVTFRPVLIALEPGATADLNLGQLGLADGVQVFDVNSIVSALSPDQRPTGEGQVMTGPTLYEVLVVDSIFVRKTTYEAAFLARRQPIRGDSNPARIDFGGGYISSRAIGALAFESAPLDPATRFTPVDLPSPVDMADMVPKQLPDFSVAPMMQLAPEMEANMTASANAPFGTIQGKLFLKVPSGNNPAWGWNVRAWQQIGSTWFQVGSAWVKGNGDWSLDFAFPPFPGIKVRIEYQPANRFVQLQDENANVYTWGDSWTFTGPITDIGWRSLNLTKTGDAPGIDVIYQAATALWRRFKVDGMNAVRDQPIQITFPNTSTSTCPQVDASNNPIPWSCSDAGNGQIWLISKHAKPGVVQHEIAHSIHSYYWNGSMPNGSGGQHTLKGCFNPGMALTEGFANFMPYWVQFERDNPGPQEAFLGYNIENPGPGFCPSASNEVRVSATFWDVYDTHNDGVAPTADTWNFFHHGAAVGTFLNNSGHNSMTEYWGVYTSILGGNMISPIFETFLLNTILP